MAGIPTQQKIIYSERQTDYNPGEEITINIEPTDVQLLNGKNTYLRCRVAITGQAQLELDRHGGGGHAIIDRISIYTGNMATLLEQLEEVPCWIGTKNFYERTRGLDGMRCLLEGHNVGQARASQGDLGAPCYLSDTTSPGDGNCSLWDPPGNCYSEFIPTRDGQPHPQGGIDGVELCLPLYMSGIFYSEKAFPVLATEGLVLKIVLNTAKRALVARCPMGFVRQKGYGSGPPTALDLPFNRGQTAQAPVATGPQPVTDGSSPPVFQLATDLPAAVVNAVDIVDDTGLAGLGAWTQVPAGGAPALTAAGNRQNCAGSLTGPPQGPVAASSYSAVGVVMNMIGQQLFVGSDAGVLEPVGRITAVAVAGPGIRFTMDGSVTLGAGQVATAANNPPVCGCIHDGTFDGATHGGVVMSEPSYQVKGVELVVSVVEPAGAYYDAMMSRLQSKTGLELDIKSFNLYRTNLYKSQMKSQHLLPLTEFRARALLHSMILPSELWNRSYYLPMADCMKYYQYNIANKLVPNRRVDCGEEAFPNEDYVGYNEVLDAERTKCLQGSKVNVLTEAHSSGRPVFGRELAKRGHSFNANKNEIRLTQDWGVQQCQGTGSAAGTYDSVLQTLLPAYDKLLYTRVHHFRKLSMKPGNVVVSF